MSNEPEVPPHAVMVPVEMLLRWREIISPYWFHDDGEESDNNDEVISMSGEIDALLAAPVSPPDAQVWRDAIEAASKACDEIAERFSREAYATLNPEIREMNYRQRSAAQDCAAAVRSLPTPPAQEGKS